MLIFWPVVTANHELMQPSRFPSYMNTPTQIPSSLIQYLSSIPSKQALIHGGASGEQQPGCSAGGAASAAAAATEAATATATAAGPAPDRDAWSMRFTYISLFRFEWSISSISCDRCSCVNEKIVMVFYGWLIYMCRSAGLMVVSGS